MRSIAILLSQTEKNRCVPAKAGTHLRSVQNSAVRRWAPAFAGARSFFSFSKADYRASLAAHPARGRGPIAAALALALTLTTPAHADTLVDNVNGITLAACR